MAYDLWYWSGIQGRGEFIRLALEAGGLAYHDRARELGDDALIKDMRGRKRAPFAPPYLDTGDAVIAQVADILFWLGRHKGLAPESEADRTWLHQIQLTVTDFVAEVHQVHHPIGVSLYYEDQRPEATRFAEEFREQRMPKFLGWFEKAIEGDWLIGDRWTYGDTSFFQIIEGLRYAFPERMKTLEKTIPKMVAIRDRIAALPELQDYLHSHRRIGFNTSGIFRHYPELDAG